MVYSIKISRCMCIHWIFNIQCLGVYHRRIGRGKGYRGGAETNLALDPSVYIGPVVSGVDKPPLAYTGVLRTVLPRTLTSSSLLLNIE